MCGWTDGRVVRRDEGRMGEKGSGLDGWMD